MRFIFVGLVFFLKVSEACSTLLRNVFSRSEESRFGVFSSLSSYIKKKNWLLPAPKTARQPQAACAKTTAAIAYGSLPPWLGLQPQGHSAQPDLRFTDPKREDCDHQACCTCDKTAAHNGTSLARIASVAHKGTWRAPEQHDVLVRSCVRAWGIRVVGLRA